MSTLFSHRVILSEVLEVEGSLRTPSGKQKPHHASKRSFAKASG
ncbi:MAG: hypothetical protein WCP97_02765 [bacterium]